MHLRLQHIAKWAFGALMLAFAGGAHAEGGKPWTSVQTNPLVIELFTSQGCSSCPPADIVLDQIADIPGVLGLAFHVDYWDYIGWKDPFATSVSTKRQKYYRHVLGNRYIYTPQFVIGGNASPDPSSGSLIDRDSIRAPKTQIMLKVTDAGILMPLTGDLPNAADIWVVHFDERHETEITKGENAGRELGYRHVVREIQYLGDWRGQERLVAWPEKHRFGVALMVQDRDEGTILATLVAME
ncbi:DUF1223 domain-containing protein [Alphaproteobacteria bacterium]|nr:DUF1223 domain-containing protein [Alphaproteobacteria bacterium]MDG1416044.1 DUF1223 domain-containing protein [Alphaproteobacteria bacterium]